MRYYIYKLYFKNGCTYIGKHKEKNPNDGYITSSGYYKMHKDLLEKREIILEVSNQDTLDIMETICILGDIAANPKNVNRNKGAWLNSSKFDRGFTGEANGMWGKYHTELTRLKMRKAWSEERKATIHQKLTGIKRPGVIEMNKSPEHIERVKQAHERFMKTQCYAFRLDDNICISVSTFKENSNKLYKWFKRAKLTNQKLISLEDFIKIYEDLVKLPYHHTSGILHWYNNGISETYATTCPDGFVKGRLKFSKDTISNMKVAAQRRLEDPVYLEHYNSVMIGRTPWNKGLKHPKGWDAQVKPILDTETGIEYATTRLARDTFGDKLFYEGKKNGRFIINYK